MKRLSLFCAALFAAVATFAGTVTYDLQGGVTNDYGWKTAQDMFEAFMTESGATGFATLAEYKTSGSPLSGTGICAKLLNPEVCFANAEKWGWLQQYIASVHAAQADDGASALPENGAGAAWRYAVGAFFIDGKQSSWPVSANFATCGVSTVAAYQSLWKHGFDNPASIEEGEWILNEPYKEGESFLGWFENAQFTGAKITKITPESNGTLYAKFGEYIPTIAEVTALQEQEVKTAGVVVLVRGTKNVYIQDASAGTLLYLANGVEVPAVGDLVTVKGTSTTYNGGPEISGATILSKEPGTLPALQTILLSQFLAKPLDYFAERIFIEGLIIESYYNNGIVLTDGDNTVQGFNIKPNEADFPVNTRVNVSCVGSYFNGAQLVGDASSVVAAPSAGHDNFSYPVLGEDVKYSLKNKWIYSNILDNFSANMPATIDHARGMVAKDGKMYFVDNNGGGTKIMGTGRLVVVDGTTGEKLEPIAITGEHLFEAPVIGEDGEPTGAYAMCATLSFNDLKIDQAGHFLIGGCVSGGDRFQIYKVDIATGAATVVVDDRLYDYPEFELEGVTPTWRFDAFNVYGDVDNHAIIMAADANSFYAYKWEITNGEAGEAERINCTPEDTDISLLIVDGSLGDIKAFGTAPQIFPIDFDYFYVDGFNHLPMLFDMEGTLVQDFATVPTGTEITMGEEVCKMNYGHNGLCEFQIGEEYFLVLAATNTVGSPTSAFAIYKYADENRNFSEMTPMWFFPEAGMGVATNGCRTAVPSVEVEGNVAKIYVYTNNNGYGVYELEIGEGTGVESALKDEAVKAVKVINNGNLFIIRNGVRYNAQGVVAE